MAKRKVNSSPEADQASRRTSRRIANINEHRKSSKVKESAAQTTGPTKASKPTAVKIEALESDKEGKGIVGFSSYQTGMSQRLVVCSLSRDHRESSCCSQYWPSI